MMETFPYSKVICGDQLAAEIGEGVSVRVSGEEIWVEGSSDRAHIQAAIDAHVPDPDFGVSVEEQTWSERLRTEAAFLDDQIATWPLNATTNQEALQRVNFLLAATKRLARNQSRILKFIDNATLDSE